MRTEVSSLGGMSLQVSPSPLRPELVSADRRSAVRVRPAWTMPIRFGRSDATVIDLSRTGIRVRHTAPAKSREHVVVRIPWGQLSIELGGFVVSSRLAALGRAGGCTIYETRLRFTTADEDTVMLLDRIVAILADRSAQAVVMRVVSAAAETKLEASGPERSRHFIQSRLLGATWHEEWVADRTLPADGVLVPASISEHALAEIHRCYEVASVDLRNLIRMAMASTADKD